MLPYRLRVLSCHLRSGVLGACLLVILAACTRSATVNEPTQPAKPDPDKTGNATQPKTAIPFYPDERLFRCSYGTGLDPKGQVKYLPRHVQTLPEIHERFVYEFTFQPGFGLERYHWQPGVWSELVVQTTVKPSAPSSSERKYPPLSSLKLDGRSDAKRRIERPTYEEEAETLTFPSEKLQDVVERIWHLKEMHLIGIAMHKMPVVYLGAGSENHAAKLDRDAKGPSKPRLRGKVPTRLPNSFESAALADLRKGTELVAKTTAAEMWLVGAIRARADCVKCHDGGEGALLGAFTYRLAWQSGAKPAHDRLTDLAKLTPDQLASIETIEAVGGTVKRDQGITGRPVSEVNLYQTKIKDTAVKVLVPFAELKTVNISYTKVTDAGVKQLVADHPSLVNLRLDSTKITDASLKELPRLKQLRMLSLWTTPITDVGVRHLRGCELLERLELAQTSITNASVEEIAGFRHLRVLSLFNLEAISDPAMRYLKDLTELEDLDLARTGITDAGLVELKNLKRLRRLNLSVTEITDEGLVHLQGLKELRALGLNSVKKLGSALKHLQNFTQLQTLELANNDFTDSMVVNLAKLTQLESLDLAISQLTDSGLATLRDFRQMRSLNLWHAAMTDTGLQHLKGLARLQNLGLGHTLITDAGLDALTGLEELRTLDLTDTKVTNEGVARLKKALPACRITR